ncbi:MAG: tetratricopeptide repeat protein, partial [Prolixibacteraceae bacterium]|nr:tetratricopeptide repeat protein [Prolixibacteraceae bacterium]
MNGPSSVFRLFITIGLFFTITTGFSQNAAVDSLLGIISQKKANAETYNQLAQEYWFIDISKSKEFAEKALVLAREEQNELQEGFAYNRLGTAFLYKRNLDSAKVYYTKSAEMFRQLEMYTELAGATACCAKIFESKFEYDSAKQTYSKALEIFEKAEKTEYYAQTIMVVGGLYSRLGDFRNAQYYFDLALANKSFLKPYDLITLYNKIGINYQKLGDFSNAIHFFEEAFKACDLSDNNIALAMTYVNTGNLYIAWNKKEAALNYLQKGLEVTKSTGIEYYRQTILLLMADIYFDFGQLNKARTYYTNLLDGNQPSKDLFNEGKAYNGLARIATIEHHFQEAINYSRQALGIFEKIQRPFHIADAHFILAENYIAVADFTKAREHFDAAELIAKKNSLKELQAQLMLLQARYTNSAANGVGSNVFYEKYIALKDSLFAKQNQELLAKFQVEMDNLEKDFQLKEAENLTKLRETELYQKKKQVAYAITISLLLLIGVVVFVIMYIRKQRANRILFLKNKELLERETTTVKKGEGIEISEALQNDILLKLETELKEHKIYLQNDLTLYSLSKQLGTNSSYLSKIIQTT